MMCCVEGAEVYVLTACHQINAIKQRSLVFTELKSLERACADLEHLCEIDVSATQTEKHYNMMRWVVLCFVICVP